MHSIGIWSWWLSVGNFLAASSIAFFALSTIYDKIDLKKYEAGLTYLRLLNDMLRGRVVVNGTIKTEVPTDPRKAIDNMLLRGLFENLFREDWNALIDNKMGVVYLDEMPDSEWDTIKYSIYQNRSKIPGLIDHIGPDWRRLKRVYKFVVLLFGLGILIQLIAILKML